MWAGDASSSHHSRSGDAEVAEMGPVAEPAGMQGGTVAKAAAAAKEA